MKFKNGDAVRVREDLHIGEIYCMQHDRFYNTFTLAAREFAGKTLTVRCAHPAGYFAVETGDYKWVDEMLEPEVASYTSDVEPLNTLDSEAEFKPGDAVICVHPDPYFSIFGKKGRVLRKCDAGCANKDWYIVEFDDAIDMNALIDDGLLGHCARCSGEDLRLISPNFFTRFVVGNQVVCTNPIEYPWLKGSVGTVVAISNKHHLPLVEFTKNVNGHNGLNLADSNGKDGCCLYFRDCELDIYRADDFEPCIPCQFIGYRGQYYGNQHPQLSGLTGVIIDQCRYTGDYLVQFDTEIPNGHDGGVCATHRGKNGYCYYCDMFEFDIAFEAHGAVEQGAPV